MSSKRIVLVAIVIACVPWSAVLAGGALQFRLGGFAPSGGGDFWADTEDAFSLESADFRPVL